MSSSTDSKSSEEDNISDIGKNIIKHIVSFFFSVIFSVGVGSLIVISVSKYFFDLTIVTFDIESQTGSIRYSMLMLVGLIGVVLYDKFKTMKSIINLPGSIAWWFFSNVLYIGEYSTDSTPDEELDSVGIKETYTHSFGPIFLICVWSVFVVASFLRTYTGIIPNVSMYSLSFLLIAGVIQIIVSLMVQPRLIAKDADLEIELFDLILRQIQSLFVLLSATSQIFDFIELELPQILATIIWVCITTGILLLIALTDRIVLNHLNNITMKISNLRE